MLRYYLFKQWQQLLDFSNKCSLFINLTFLGCWIIHVLSIEYQNKEYDPEISIHMLLRSKFWGVDFIFILRDSVLLRNLELTILLSQFSECCDHRHVPLSQAKFQVTKY